MNETRSHSPLRMLAVLLLVLALFTACTSSAQKAAQQLELGRKYLTEQNYAEAVAAFTEAIQLDPNNIDAYMGRAEAYKALQKYEEAADDYSTVIEKTADQPYTQALAYQGRADLYEQTEEWAKAESDYSAILPLLDTEGAKNAADDETRTELKKDVLKRHAAVCITMELFEKASADYDTLEQLGEDVSSARDALAALLPAEAPDAENTLKPAEDSAAEAELPAESEANAASAEEPVASSKEEQAASKQEEKPASSAASSSASSAASSAASKQEQSAQSKAEAPASSTTAPKGNTLKTSNHTPVAVGTMSVEYHSNQSNFSGDDSYYTDAFLFDLTNTGSAPVTVWTEGMAPEFRIICNGQEISLTQYGSNGHYVLHQPTSEDDPGDYWEWVDNDSNVLAEGDEQSIYLEVEKMPRSWKQCTVVYSPVYAPNTTVEFTIDNPW